MLISDENGDLSGAFLQDLVCMNAWVSQGSE